VDIRPFAILLRGVPLRGGHIHFMEGGHDLGVADAHLALFEVADIALPGGRLLLYLQLVLVLILILVIIGQLLILLGLLRVGSAGSGLCGGLG
jgi:hypothetical protein